MDPPRVSAHAARINKPSRDNRPRMRRDAGLGTGNAPHTNQIRRIQAHNAYSADEVKSIARACTWARPAARVDQPALASLDRQRGQQARTISSGIDADPIGPLIHLIRDGMPVDDDEAMVALVEQEGLADPAQVRLALLVDLDARPDSGMDEQIVTEPAAIDEGLDELDMLLGYSRTNE